MVAGWEAATDQKIAHNAVMREFGALRTQQQETLDSRRQALAQKLYAEEAALQRELAQCAATPEEKRAALAERAQSLWEAREAERQATANALLERHFRCGSKAHPRVPPIVPPARSTPECCTAGSHVLRCSPRLLWAVLWPMMLRKDVVGARMPRTPVPTATRACRENSDQLRALFSQKTAQATLAARQRQVEDNTARRINALHEKTAWDECEAFEGLKATMQGARPPRAAACMALRHFAACSASCIGA